MKNTGFQIKLALLKDHSKMDSYSPCRLLRGVTPPFLSRDILDSGPRAGPNGT